MPISAMRRRCALSSFMTCPFLVHNHQHKYATNAWAVLKSFGYIAIVEDLATAHKVHSLENVMMMEVGLHVFF